MNHTPDDPQPVAPLDRVEAAAGQGRMIDLLRVPAFRRLWIGVLIGAFGGWSERLAVSWFVFNATGSVLLTGLVATAQYAQNMFLGPIAGAVSDRYPRNRILTIAATLKIVAVLSIAALVRLPSPPLVVLFLLITLSAACGTFNGAALQTLASEIAGSARRARATSLVSSGQRAVAAVGALTSGFLIGWGGVSSSVLLSAIMLGLAAFVYSGLRDPRTPGHASRRSLAAETVEGLQLVRHQPILATLLGLAAAAEVFGFSYQSLLPALAERVLGVGAFGFGALSGVASVGSVAATLWLAAVGNRVRHGALLIAVFAVFGTLLIALGASRIYLLSMGIAIGLGACTALVDTLELIMLQSAVEERLRGRAVGAWNAAFGLGWMGPLILGAIADAVSLPVAYTFAGCMLLAIAAGTAVGAPRLRGASNRG